MQLTKSLKSARFQNWDFEPKSKNRGWIFMNIPSMKLKRARAAFYFKFVSKYLERVKCANICQFFNPDLRSTQGQHIFSFWGIPKLILFSYNTIWLNVVFALWKDWVFCSKLVFIICIKGKKWGKNSQKLPFVDISEI